MILYSLALGGKQIVVVEMENFDWLPVRPKLHRPWLRYIVGNALRAAFSASKVVRA